MLSKNKKNIKMKNCYLYIMMLLLASCSELRASDSPEAKTLLGIIIVDQGDTISGMNLMKEAADQGCSLDEC